MKIEQINPFVTAVKNVMGLFGVTDIESMSVQIKEEMIIDQDVTAFVGMVGDLKGNVSYCFSNEVAKNIASVMMMGMPVDELNAMVRSALAELSNMLTGNAASIFAEDKVFVDITPPSLVTGEDMYFILTFLQTYSVVLKTSFGNIEMNIALEE